ncbi:arylsulfatase [Tamlana sp. 2201CG12-4]|uniref:sulfatase family protein n=1 Tax=Tamlana sp. 2201CG12-4 TaxID=3112582 RepID=UPI002DB5DC9A|nr:arylsulfatase [Tamlana sp. 2201CG12-4]MEC3907035.1 arylsulfatase [Tamlana sp. 2201CG12-4]
MNKLFSILLILSMFSCKSKEQDNGALQSDVSNTPPNVVIFYVDDLGYADLSSYGASGVKTPNVDRLANNGVKFTDAHSSAATCTPSRYSLLTGQYAFRNKAVILPGDAPLLIRPETPTLPKMFKKAGYKTAVVGKWHLGLGNGDVNWNGQVKPGPLEIGFDYSFLLPATGDRTPTVYLENHNVVNLNLNDSLKVSYETPFSNEPLGVTHPELLRQKADLQHSQALVNGISRIGYQTGGKEAMWVDEEFPDVFTGKAIDFMRNNKDNPFFLFFSFHDIHVPRVPNERFIGKSTMGPRGDAIVQMDWMTGQIIKELENLSLDKNTLVIFTSDNGPVLDDGYADLAEEKLGGHTPSGPFRGGKYSAYEAGTRVPMITYWPEKIQPGESSALISQTDYYASLASLINVSLQEGEALDSENVKQAIVDAKAPARNIMLEESFTLSLRKGNWKYIAPLGEKDTPEWLSNKKIEMGLSPVPQLYDLSKDIGEQSNIASLNKEIVEALQAKIDSIVILNSD